MTCTGRKMEAINKGKDNSKTGKCYDLNTAPADILLKTEDMLASLNIKRTTLYVYVKKKHLPPPFEKCGKENHWMVGQIRQWRLARAAAMTALPQQKMVEECQASSTYHFHDRAMDILNSDLDL